MSKFLAIASLEVLAFALFIVAGTLIHPSLGLAVGGGVALLCVVALARQQQKSPEDRDETE